MNAIRAGLLTGLLLFTGFTAGANNAHQGEYHHWHPQSLTGHATLLVEQSPSELVFVANSKGTSGNAATLTARTSQRRSVRLPIVRITHVAFLQWSRVATCEEGGWHNAHGPTYWGALGWLQATWNMFRRHDFPARMDTATIAEQVWAAERFANYYHFIPDQYGCTGGY